VVLVLQRGKATCSKKLLLTEKAKQAAGTASTMSQAIEVEGNSSEDSDYIPGDDSASEDDEEAKEILKKSRNSRGSVSLCVSQTDGRFECLCKPN